jgi:hypothetical protein
VYSNVLGAANYLTTTLPSPSKNPIITEAMPKDVPKTPNARRKYFLDAEMRRRWTWRKGKEYAWDFCNGMMDFNGEFLTWRDGGGKD